MQGTVTIQIDSITPLLLITPPVTLLIRNNKDKFLIHFIIQQFR